MIQPNTNGKLIQEKNAGQCNEQPTGIRIECRTILSLTHSRLIMNRFAELLIYHVCAMVTTLRKIMTRQFVSEAFPALKVAKTLMFATSCKEVTTFVSVTTQQFQ